MQTQQMQSDQGDDAVVGKEEKKKIYAAFKATVEL